MSQESGSGIHGRCVAVRETSGALGLRKVTLRNEGGTHSIEVAGGDEFAPGDVIEIVGRQVKRLTPNRHPERSARWMERTLDPRRRKALSVRALVEGGIRDFFGARGFLETRTPLLVQCPGMETHIRPFSVQGGAYLPTSPEFAMKRLLSGGLEKIFQLCPAFRYEPVSTTHHPEFTILEWYRAYTGYEAIMRDTEELFAAIATELHGKPVVGFQGRDISVATPWPRLRVRDLFAELGVDLVREDTPAKLAAQCRRLGLESGAADTWDDLYFRIWLNLIEPRLPADRAVFVHRYPPSQAALSVMDQDPDGTPWAKRFEVYAGGLELGNAFEELTDPVEQRARFTADMESRARIYGPSFPKNPLDEEFLTALEEGMPPSGGIAMGVDRMVMLFANEPDIDYTLWLRSYSPDRPG